MKFVFILSVLTAAASAQVVRVANLAPLPFVGWKRTTIDSLPPHAVGQVGGATYVVGRQVGLETHVVDVFVSLGAGQQVALDLSQAAPASWTRGAFPGNPLAAFGGWPTLDGQPMQLVTLQADGAGYSLHLRARPQPMLAADLWVTWDPDQPAFCQGEIALVASNPTIPDLEVVLTPTMPLTFGSAVTLPLGGTPMQLLPDGLTLADGQARILPLTFVWPSLLVQEQDWASMLVAASFRVGAVGIANLLVDGNPGYPAGFSARTWTNVHWAESVRRLHTMEAALFGPARMSSVTGRQEDQTFVRGEAMLVDGPGAELITYFNALKLAARPCHHLEADGRPLELALHVNPRLVFWDGRVHWSPLLSPDRLGKPATISIDVTKGWWGPDVEHWLMNTLAAATRLTGSPACQWLLGHQARIYQLQLTTIPGVSTSSAFAARSVGWEGILAVHLWRELEDRTLAAEVRAHWQNRVVNVILPTYANRPGDVWDPRFDDPRLGKGWWYHPWQQAVGAYGLDLGCQVLGPASGRAVALAAARAVMRDAFALRNGRWINFAGVALDGRRNDDGIFYLFGSPLAPAVVLRHHPFDAQARSIWNQMHADATGTEHWAWFAPGVP